MNECKNVEINKYAQLIDMCNIEVSQIEDKIGFICIDKSETCKAESKCEPSKPNESELFWRLSYLLEKLAKLNDSIIIK